MIATEGSLLTFIGKISYDVSNDEITLIDNLGFVGGGLTEALT